MGGVEYETLRHEIVQLKLGLRERDQRIFDLEEEIREKNAIIVDKCQLIERLEQSSNHQHCYSPDLVISARL